MNRIATLTCIAAMAYVCRAAVSPPTVLEAESLAAPDSEIFRDSRASGGKCVGIILDDGKALAAGKREMPAGDYEAAWYLEIVPVEVLHHLAVTLRIGREARTLGQMQFDPRPGYQSVRLRFFHPGGDLALSVSGEGGSGFDGMRSDMSERERVGAEKLQPEIADKGDIFGEEAVPADDGIDELDGLEEERSVSLLRPYEHRMLCDKVELRLLRAAPVMVVRASVDKIHYLPGETVAAEAVVQAAPGNAGPCRLVAEELTETDDTREVFATDVDVRTQPSRVHFSFGAGKREFGRELRCSLHRNGRVLHAASALFGVSRNVYRIGITANGGPQNTQTLTAEKAASLMQANKRAFANYFERFAWAACDYSNLAPETELFWSGQTQYPGSISGFRNLLAEAHKVGVKGITYGKSCAGGIEGFKTFQRHPELFRHAPEGTGTEMLNVFYLERMLANDYRLGGKASEGGWQHWPSLWTDWTRNETVVFGAEAVMKSIEMFGWDGIRWDGHFVGNQKPFIDLLRKRYPDFVHGYNIAFADPEGTVFLPPADAVEDFHLVGGGHGLMMDESVRNWSHTNFSPGYTRAFYAALCREADYIKRIGGLPLYIVFDMASAQDRTLNVLCGLAAGQRYTYITSPGDFAYGPLPRFLTRYSAFVWDDTKRLARPDDVLSVRVGGGPEGVEPWWRESVWVREVGESRRQLLVNLLNPPGYEQFCNRVQPPPATLTDVAVRFSVPAGAEVTQAHHLSPDLPAGHEALEPTRDGVDAVTVTVPRLRRWSIVAFDLQGDTTSLAITTPIDDAAAVLARQAGEERQKAEREKADAGIAPAVERDPATPPYADYARVFNADADAAKAAARPENMAIERNGVLDVHHARGPFSWLNPVESAAGVLGGVCDPSWVDLVGFKLGDKGCMDEFPGDYDAMLGYDVLVLDNVHARYLGRPNRVRIGEFVEAGGGLLVFGGYHNLSCGADHNSALAELLPVRIARFRDLVIDPVGIPLQPAKPGFFGRVKWATPAHAFTVDVSELKHGAEVLVRAGEHPAIVARPRGKGRVIAVLINPHGDYDEKAKPYWQWSQWPRLIADCLAWLGAGSELDAARTAGRRVYDDTKPLPDELMLDAVDLDSREFTARLKAVRHNMIDADSARLVLQIALDSADKIEEPAVLSDVAERAKAYVDESFVPLAEKLVESHHTFIRQAGYQLVGMAGGAAQLGILERGLKEEEDVPVVRATLVAVARMGDAAAQRAVREYLPRGSEKLLAASVLIRLGDKAVLPEALSLFEQSLRRRVRLKSGRRKLHDRLYGGVSFKLTKAERRRYEIEYRDVKQLEANARFDVRYFAEAIASLEEADLDVLVRFLIATETREVLPTAYAALNRMPEDQAAAARQKLAGAKLPELRLLAGE